MNSKRWIVGADLHFPKVSWPTFNVMVKVIADIKPDGFVFQGDQFDNEEISHHNAKKPIYKPQGSYKKNTDKFDAEILKPLEKALGKAEKVWITGNHDRFEFDFIEAHPELEGMIERANALKLEARGWEIIPLAHAFVLGELNIIHGEILTGVGNQAGAFPAKKAVEIYGSNVLAAHTHAPQSFAKVSPVEQKKKHMGWIAPILGATNPTYLRNRPTAWMNGFTLIELYDVGNKQFFNLFPMLAFDGKCAYGGKVYAA
jgi:Calcineurin-like phosphoesterase